MGNRIVLLILLTLLFTNSYAGIVPVGRAKAAGEKFMRNRSVLRDVAQNDMSLTLVHTYSDSKGYPYLYVFNVNDNAFVVVSAEDRVKPILAYSTEGSFSNEDIAPAFNFTMESYIDDIEYIRDNDVARLDDIRDEWERVESSGAVKSQRNKRSVPMLLETKWNQNYPYNMLCPEDEEGIGGHVYAGCVATAMAQVMKYFNYPEYGNGSFSYIPITYGYNYPQQNANFGETFYNFERMPMTLDSTSSYEDIFHIAQLQWHCGVSVEMMYGPEGSGVYSEKIPHAVSEYFRYNANTEIVYKNWYYNSSWMQLLKSQLDDNCPVYYAGSDVYGAAGHAFVCDGYDENDFFHFNWGWDGKDDAWCAICALNTTKYAFNNNNHATKGFYPAEEDYYRRANKVSDLAIVESESLDAVTLSWTNPLNNLNGEELNIIDSVIVRRDFVKIASFSNPQPGESCSFVDELLEPGNYEYSVLVKTEYGYSAPVYQRIMVGPKCDIVFDMTDAGGDGWKGASVSVVCNGVRIAIVSMTEGAEESRVVPLLKGDLSFYWNKDCLSDYYSTDDEIAFDIYDAEENLLYSSQDVLVPGKLFDYNNDCASVDEKPHKAETVDVFPNPSNDKVTVKAKGMSNVSLFNIMGQELMSLDTDDDEMIVDVADLSDGVYLIYVKTTDKLNINKIIVSK
ncbi:MAG: C10 family peptidase [Candidatus Limimorpha sp.]